jgi:hypothetical protein
LRLTADDGAASDSDEVRVIVEKTAKVFDEHVFIPIIRKQSKG